MSKLLLFRIGGISNLFASIPTPLTNNSWSSMGNILNSVILFLEENKHEYFRSMGKSTFCMTILKGNTKEDLLTSINYTCGGILDASNGTLNSPSFPDLYPTNKNCIWEIIAPPQYRITLNFTHFDLEGNNHDCEYDSVSIISKLAGSQARRHGVFCGPSLPPTITSYSNNLRIEFNSDATVQKSGFAAIFFTDKDECATNNGGCQHICKNSIGSYVCSCHNGFMLHENKHDCKEGGCKHEISTPIGEISSPNYPDYYPSRKDCIWHFTTTPGHRIKLSPQELQLMVEELRTASNKVGLEINLSKTKVMLNRTVEIQPIMTGNVALDQVDRNTYLGQLISIHRDWEPEVFNEFEMEPHQECAYDHIVFYDGDDTEDITLGRFCGSKVPHPIVASSNEMYMVFKSDASVQRKGFKATHTTVCGGHLIASLAVHNLYSHAKYGDLTYDNKEDCDWIIKAEKSQQVKLRFLTFDVEQEQDCGYDFVEIYDGYDDSSIRLGRFCGKKIPPVIVSSGKYLLLRFRSDDTINSKGFSCSYTEVNFENSVDVDETYDPIPSPHYKSPKFSRERNQRKVHSG
ncbi:Tolloid-like protein 1 [Nymphon striatum]|nr:Tolloid-like protein 1 [Nymphon striatum]